MLPLVLVIASDRDLREPFRHELTAAGFKAYYVESLAAALAVVAQWRFDAALLLGRGFDGTLLHMLHCLREAADVPTLAIVDAADEERQLQALDAGAAQVLVEPTSLRIVAAQLRCLVGVAQQRPRHERADVRFGPLRLDPRRAAATIGTNELALTSGEFELLLLLASRPGELVHRETIARTLGRSANPETRRSADMHVCRIRRKLREVAGHTLHVETVYGRGYLLRDGPAHDEADEQRAVEWSV
jgi:DNA-binding response OmpR family regulator